MIGISDKEEEPAESILESLGFGELANLLKKSDVFSEKMDEVNEQIKERLDEDDWEEAKPKFDYNFSIDTLEGGGTRSSRPKKGARPRNKNKGDESSWSTGSAKFKEGKEKRKKKNTTSESQKNDPLVDLFDEGDSIRIVAMFPETSKEEELELKLRSDELTLATENQRETIHLPFPVKEDPSISFKNGIFDIEYQRK
ncbi:hypothetical protein KGY71_06460 [Candidatus Bipolaricaulota bacterium]|nr:hypothetical protein [Candidatus Bipolaricaulota bacterium]